MMDSERIVVNAVMKILQCIVDDIPLSKKMLEFEKEYDKALKYELIKSKFTSTHAPENEVSISLELTADYDVFNDLANILREDKFYAVFAENEHTYELLGVFSTDEKAYEAIKIQTSKFEDPNYFEYVIEELDIDEIYLVKN